MLIGCLPGERVCLLAPFTAFRTFVRIRCDLVHRIPKGMSFIEAASLPTSFLTAWVSLHQVSRLRKDESVLIHSGAGGTGQAAIPLAQNVGARIFMTLGTPEKKQLLIDHYNLPESNIKYSRDTTFVSDILNSTSQRGVDVVLNSLPGDRLISSWECIAPFGRFVWIGKRDIDSHKSLPMPPFAENATFIAIDLKLIAKERPSIIRESLRTTYTLIDKGELRPARPLHIFPIGEIVKGLRYIQGGQSAGKIVLEALPDLIVPVYLLAHLSFARPLLT